MKVEKNYFSQLFPLFLACFKRTLTKVFSRGPHPLLGKRVYDNMISWLVISVHLAYYLVCPPFHGRILIAYFFLAKKSNTTITIRKIIASSIIDIVSFRKTISIKRGVGIKVRHSPPPRLRRKIPSLTYRGFFYFDQKIFIIFFIKLCFIFFSLLFSIILIVQKIKCYLVL